jgi:hypothetical protein
MVGGPENCLCKNGELEFAVERWLRSTEWLHPNALRELLIQKLEIEN